MPICFTRRKSCTDSVHLFASRFSWNTSVDQGCSHPTSRRMLHIRRTSRTPGSKFFLCSRMSRSGLQLRTPHKRGAVDCDKISRPRPSVRYIASQVCIRPSLKNISAAVFLHKQTVVYRARHITEQMLQHAQIFNLLEIS